MTEAPPRWLLVVDASQRELYEMLRERLQGSGLEVVLERRQSEARRRPAGGGPEPEGRQAERRYGQSVAGIYPVLSVGERLASIACPECSVALEFEMPPLEPSAARVETTVLHRHDASFGVQHYVDVRAVLSAGKPSVQRVQARRRMPRR